MRKLLSLHSVSLAAVVLASAMNPAPHMPARSSMSPAPVMSQAPWI